MSSLIHQASPLGVTGTTIIDCAFMTLTSESIPEPMRARLDAESGVWERWRARRFVDTLVGGEQ